jgi:acylphosphatase
MLYFTTGECRSSSEVTSGQIRAEVFFSGRVQGVGFRYTVRNVASSFDVTGFVKNLPDGRVQLIAEGTADVVDRFVEAVAEAMGGFIRETQMQQSAATGTFSTFDVAF